MPITLIQNNLNFNQKFLLKYIDKLNIINSFRTKYMFKY